MVTRRDVLSVAAGAVGGAVVTKSTDSTEQPTAPIEWANELDQVVTVEIDVQTTGGILSSPKKVYQDRFRLFQTEHYRVTDWDAVETGRYEVAVSGVSADGDVIGPTTTMWTRSDCRRQRLIVRIERDHSIVFNQREC